MGSLDEALLSCGEVALVVEQDGDVTKFVSYALPRQGNNFVDGEIRNAFLSQMMENSAKIIQPALTVFDVFGCL